MNLPFSADPDVQMVAQRLLAREGFVPAGDQLNIIAAAWIHAQGERTKELSIN